MHASLYAVSEHMCIINTIEKSSLACYDNNTNSKFQIQSALGRKVFRVFLEIKNANKAKRRRKMGLSLQQKHLCENGNVIK